MFSICASASIAENIIHLKCEGRAYKMLDLPYTPEYHNLGMEVIVNFDKNTITSIMVSDILSVSQSQIQAQPKGYTGQFGLMILNRMTGGILIFHRTLPNMLEYNGTCTVSNRRF